MRFRHQLMIQIKFTDNTFCDHQFVIDAGKFFWIKILPKKLRQEQLFLLWSAHLLRHSLLPNEQFLSHITARTSYIQSIMMMAALY